MDPVQKNYVWHKQTIADDLEIIECKPYHPIHDFRRDPTGVYVLIRLDRSLSLIEAAVCDKDHVIRKVFRGKKCQDLFYTIFQYEQDHGLKWFQSKEHMAYLGKELKKAELAIKYNSEYVQE